MSNRPNINVTKQCVYDLTAELRKHLNIETEFSAEEELKIDMPDMGVRRLVRDKMRDYRCSSFHMCISVKGNSIK